MAETKIEWTATHLPDGSVVPGYSFNPWIGCTKVHEGCLNCYAERDMDIRLNAAAWGDSGSRVMTSSVKWRTPYKWNKDASKDGIRRRVFCASIADVFEDWQGEIWNRAKQPLFSRPDGSLTAFTKEIDVDAGKVAAQDGPPRVTMDELRRRLFAIIDETPNLDWLLLTKRPENVRRMIPDVSGGGKYRGNVWIGTSVSNQKTAEKMVPHLMDCRDLSPVLFLSVEPLLGELDLTHLRPVNKNAPCTTNALDGITTWPDGDADGVTGGVDWVIAGYESGAYARPGHPSWARSLRDQCVSHNVPFFFKQWGEWHPCDASALHQNKQFLFEDGTRLEKIGKRNAGRLLDGVEWNQFPAFAKWNI